MKIPTEKEVEALSKEYEELFLALRDLSLIHISEPTRPY